MEADKKLYTAEELWELWKQGKPRELRKGKLITYTPGGVVHSRLAEEFERTIQQFVLDKKITGYAFGPNRGFILNRNPDSVFSPDAGYIARTRLGDERFSGRFVPIAPNLAVEIMASKDSASDIHDKVLEYMQYGTFMIWVVYPTSRSIAVHTPEGTKTLNQNAVLYGQEDLAGFRIQVSELFTCLDVLP